MKKIKMSQSLMKALFKYKLGEKCGKQIEAQYVNGVQFPSTDTMELGNYFEFICTGSLAMDGHVPEAKTTKSGKPTAKYQLMESQKANFEKLLKEYGFTITGIDYHFEHPECSGIADVIAEDKDGNRVIIDIKTTGLINDKWSEFGWHDDFIGSNDNLLIQARHYKMLAEHEWGIFDVPFYFFVFSTNNAEDYKIIKVTTTRENQDMHERNVEGAISILDKLLENGFKAIPNYKECEKCPLNNNGCNYFVSVPTILEIEC